MSLLGTLCFSFYELYQLIVHRKWEESHSMYLYLSFCHLHESANSYLRIYGLVVPQNRDQIPLCRKQNASLQKRILHWTSSANSFLFFLFQSNMVEAVRAGGEDSMPWDSLRLPLLATITIYKDDLCSLKWRGQKEGKITRRRTKWVPKWRWCFSLDEMGHTKKMEREGRSN